MAVDQQAVRERRRLGRVFSVEVERRCFPNGREHEITVVRHPPSVVLIPIDDVGRVVLVRQYRASVDRELWELPAGSLEPGESAEAAAARECEEEIGEELMYFRLSGLRAPAPDSVHRPDEDEDIDAQAFEVTDARAMAARGEIVDLKTAYGLTLI